jgi:hypothetical protein
VGTPPKLHHTPPISPTVFCSILRADFAQKSPTAHRWTFGDAISPALVNGSQGAALVRQAWRLWRYTWQRMAWRFRRSLKFGPLKLNLSKSGMGYSVGRRSFRVGQDARGRSYTATSIPGTGLYSRTYSGQGRTAGRNAAGLPGAAAGRNSGTGLAVGMLALAFGAGVLLTLILSAVLSTPSAAPPVTPPAAVSAPVAPLQPIPAKRRRAHGSRPASAPGLPRPSTSPASHTPQTPPRPTSDASLPAN